MSRVASRLYPPSTAYLAWSLVCGGLVAVTACVPSPAWPVPAGRSWSSPEPFYYPGLDPRYGIPVLDVDSAGRVLLHMGVRWNGRPAGGSNRFAWKDSAWADPVECLPPAAGITSIALSLGGPSFISWMSWPEDELYDTRMVVANLAAECSPAETVMVTTGQDSEYGGASAGRRRWIARSQQRVPDSQTFGVRVAYSDTTGVWHEVHDVGIDDGMCDIAPLNDTTAIVAYAGESGFGYAILGGSQWVTDVNLIAKRNRAVHPRFRFRPSGGLWLIWPDERDRMHVSRYVDGQFIYGDSLIVPRPPGDTYAGAWCAVSRDTAERPTLVWSENGYAYTYRDVIAISMPNDSSWDYGEEIPGSEGGNIPAVSRDGNGDAWVMWRNLRLGTTTMSHTYTSVTCAPPQVVGHGRDRTVTWTLSAGAPHSWWSVLRARAEDDFVPVARIESGHDSVLSWTDRSPPAGILRYKLRRECLDTRYQWTSGEGRWPPRSSRPLALGPVPTPSTDSVVMDVADASGGEVIARIYDIQGRLIRTRRVAASGLGHDTLRLDLRGPEGPVSSGVYFLRVEDASGSQSNAVRIVILR